MPDIDPPAGVPFPARGGRGDRDVLSDVAAELGALRARVDRLEHDHVTDRATITELTDLGNSVADLSETVTAQAAGLGSAPGDAGGEAGPAVWSWVGATWASRADHLRELAVWVRDVLRTRYPARVRILRPCWPWHPTVVEELLALYGVWADAWLGQYSTARAAMDWHDRWLDGVVHRLTRDKEFSACTEEHTEQLAIAEAHGEDAAAALAVHSLRGRAVVVAAYNDLAAAGDPRTRKPVDVDGLAAELAQRAGMSADKTRRVLAEHLAQPAPS